MKWLIVCLLAVVMVSAAYAGEDPYIAIVGNDCPNYIESSNDAQPCVGEPWYWSQKLQQFMFDQELWSVPVCDSGAPIGLKGIAWPKGAASGCEQFRSNKPLNQPEICDASGIVNNFSRGDFSAAGFPNAVITKQNAGWFEWWIRLPKKPSGEINICIQCGVLKPNTFTPFTMFGAIEMCAAETGERIGTGFCTNDEQLPGVNPINEAGLPMLEVKAYPGPYNPDPTFTNAFHLTAYKNPGPYVEVPGGVGGANPPGSIGNPMPKTSYALQLLDGTYWSRILLKACMDKCVVAKIPVTGQQNGAGEYEYDLEAGDIIQVRMQIPIYNTVDIYCNPQSASLRGIGESPF